MYSKIGDLTAKTYSPLPPPPPPPPNPQVVTFAPQGDAYVRSDVHYEFGLRILSFTRFGLRNTWTVI